MMTALILSFAIMMRFYEINIENCDIEFDTRDLYMLNNEETYIEFEVNPLVFFS